MNVDNTVRLLLYFPLTALITLFTHVIMDPLNAAAAKDIALMEAVNGLFGHLDFVSSGLGELKSVRELTKLAQQVVKEAEGKAGAVVHTDTLDSAVAPPDPGYAFERHGANGTQDDGTSVPVSSQTQYDVRSDNLWMNSTNMLERSNFDEDQFDWGIITEFGAIRSL
jgi:hypothetical protein